MNHTESLIPVSLLLISEREAWLDGLKSLSKSTMTCRIDISERSNIEAALSSTSEVGPDIVLIDRDNIESSLAESLKSLNQRFLAIPVVVVTDKPDWIGLSATIVAGATDCIAREHLDAYHFERMILHAIDHFTQTQLLDQQEQITELVFSQSRDGIFITDSSWNTLEVNQAFVDMFDVDPSLEKDKIYKRLLPDEGQQAEFIQELKEEGHVENFQTKITVLGSEQEYLIACTPIEDIEGGIIQYQGVIRNITRFKEAERALARADQFNLSGRMARIIGHEVRNPLSNILLATDHLRETLADKDETAAVYFDILERNTRRISDLIDGLLNSTRFSELNIQEFEASELIASALAICNDRLKLKKVEVRTPSLENVRLHGDQEKVEIILVNIVTNAIEAVDQVENPLISIDVKCEEQMCHITISDNGTGMDEKTREKLFDPFFTSRHGGMGLGMSSVMHLVDMHNGKISVSSTLGEGSTFTISLPNVQQS